MRQRAMQSQRLYQEIKSDLLNGVFLPGERIESNVVADKFGTSATPVRMALSRLAGERLVEAQSYDGFHAPFLTETSVIDLFNANLQQLRICLELGREAKGIRPGYECHETRPVLKLERLFNAMARASANPELEAIVDNFNDRLHTVRQVQEVLYPTQDGALTETMEKWRQNDLKATFHLLRHWHQLGISRVRETVAHIRRRPD